MGYFSWKTSDTNKSIPNNNSGKKIFGVKLITPDGKEFIEKNYEGYGDFGGKDIYELIAELNIDSNLKWVQDIFEENKNKPLRNIGLKITFFENSSGDFTKCFEKGLKMPKITTLKYKGNFEDIPYPENCEFQGYFYSIQRTSKRKLK